jgi:hypothetical protein
VARVRCFLRSRSPRAGSPLASATKGMLTPQVMK